MEIDYESLKDYIEHVKFTIKTKSYMLLGCYKRHRREVP